MSNTQRLERELKKKSILALSHSTGGLFSVTWVQNSWGNIILELKIFYYPIYSLSYERFHGGLFKNKQTLFTTFLSLTSIVISW